MKTLTITEARNLFENLKQQPLNEPCSVQYEQENIAVILAFEDFQRLLQAAKQGMSAQPKNLLDFLGAGKTYSRFSSVADIDAFIADNRELWDTASCND